MASPSGEVLISREGNQVKLTLHNPERRNAISAPMWRSLRDFTANAAADRTIRAVIIGGDGDVFSAGADITGFDAGRSSSSARDYDDLVETTLRTIEVMPQVAIAAIAGPCVGAGASLACACDFRVAEEGAFFAVPAARLGLGYDPRGIARFVRIFGESSTREVLLLATRITATRAHQLGAVQRLVEAGRSTSEASKLAQTAAANAPLTQWAAKATLYELATRLAPSAEVLRLTAAADASRDYTEGRAAFAKKRPPKFTGN